MPSPTTKTKAPTASAPTVSVKVQRKAARKDLQVVWRGLRAFNKKAVGSHPNAHFLVEARSPRGKLLGGLQGVIYYQWLFVANFFLPPSLRRDGIGSRIIAEAERHAESLGCHGVWLDTFGWQARPFYEKQGYSVFGSLPDYPKGHARWFMMKPLTPSGGERTKTGAKAKGPRPQPASRTKTRRA